tara:strand:- start:47 stop:532 length:486 start_codon:yes stop_codon:yes gene_type:complete
MEIILLENIQNLGELGDVVRVRSGYARNYLVPQGKAAWASEEAKAQVEERRKELAKLDSERMDAAKAKVDLLPKSLTVARRAGEEGRLFGSVSAIDIVELLQDAELAIQRSEIDMPNGSIKELGEHEIQVILHPQVRQSLNIVVTAEHVEDDKGTGEENIS